MPNPFAAKVKKKPAAESSNPFAAKVSKAPKPAPAASNGRPAKRKGKSKNPFLKPGRSTRTARRRELEDRITQAERDYEAALAKAVKGGVNKEQVNKLFDIADRHMRTLMGLGRMHSTMTNHSGTNPDRVRLGNDLARKKKRREAKA